MENVQKAINVFRRYFLIDRKDIELVKMDEAGEILFEDGEFDSWASDLLAQ